MSQSLTVHLTIVDADPTHPDPTAITHVAGGTADALRQAGVSVTPRYTGTRGGAAFEIIQQVADTLAANKDLLIALANLATPMVTFLLAQHRDRQQRQQSEDTSAAPTVIIKVGSAEQAITVEKQLSEDELLQQLLAMEPQLTAPVTPDTPIQIEVSVPPPPPRRRR